MKAYKLTDENKQTYGGCQWGENVTHEASGHGELCTPGWIHVYDCPIKAILLDPIHANFNPKTMQLWECEVSGNSKDDLGRKLGVQKCTTIKRIPIPNITLEQKIEFTIRCALVVYRSVQFINWANNWLSGKDRTRAAAYAAATDDRAAAADAAYARAYAADAAYARAYAADARADACADAAAARADARADAAAARAYARAYAADTAGLISKIITQVFKKGE